MNIDYDAIGANEIDSLLTEIEQQTSVEESKQRDNVEEDHVDWSPILQAIKTGNITFIKGLITSNDIGIDSQNPENGRTLLIYAVIIGNVDFVKQCCNFGANVNIKCHNDLDAFDYATKYARYKITELIYYRRLQGTLGNDLKNIATEIHSKNKEAKLLSKFKFPIGDGGGYYDVSYGSISKGIVTFMMQAIEYRRPFSCDMLYYAWYFTINEYGDQALGDHCKLWTTMMKTYTEILRDTSDKIGWAWLKKYFITSLIWYLPHPINSKKNEETHDEDGRDDMDSALKQTLFYELLVRVREESKKQSNELLKENIDQIKLKQPDEWNELVSYNTNTKYSSDARQDVCGCLKPKYTEMDLSESKYPPSTHFSAKKHYDTNIYLNELIFRANIVDRQFQRDMKWITKTISMEIGDPITYRAGPIKTLQRSQTKVENDYISCKYPTSAKILDINRCALQFETIQSLMKFIELFSTKIKNKSARCIKEIIRCKNGWAVYNVDYPQYTDIKLNVFIESAADDAVIAEVQLLLRLMSSFKKIAHKLYAVERKFELVYNFQKMADEMSHFHDAVGTNGVVLCLTQKDDIHHFKLFWNTIQPTMHTLTEQKVSDLSKVALFDILQQQGKIHEYLRTEFPNVYYQSILRTLQRYSSLFKQVAKQASTGDDEDEPVSGAKKDEQIISFIDRLFNCVNPRDSNYEQKMMTLLSGTGNILGAILRGQDKEYNFWYTKTIEYVLNHRGLNDAHKWTLCYEKDPILRLFDCIYALPILQYFMNDRHKMKQILIHPTYSNSPEFGKSQRNVLLHCICGSNARQSTKILDLIFTSPLFSKRDILELFAIRDSEYEHKIPFYYACDGYSGNLFSILNYVNDKSQIIDWLCSSNRFRFKKLTKQQKWSNSYYSLHDASFGALYELIKYFSDDGPILYRMLSMKGHNSGGQSLGVLFDKIILKNQMKLLKLILYDCAGLSYRHILKLATLGTKSIEKHASGLPFFAKDESSSSQNVLLESGLEIVSYFKNDRKTLLRLLSYSAPSAEQKTFFMFLCECIHNYHQKHIMNKRCMNVIVNESTLTMKDIFDLLHATDHVKKASLSGMHYAFRYSGFADLFLSYFANHGRVGKQLLLKLLLQPLKAKRDDKPTVCIFLASNQKAVKRALSIFPETILPKLVMERDQISSLGSNAYSFSLVQAHDFNKYVTYLNDDEKYKEIDFTFSDYKPFGTNPFFATCYLGKIQTFNTTLAKYVNGNKEKLVQLLLTTDKLPDSRDKMTVLMAADNDIRLNVLNIIKDDLKSLYKIFKSEDVRKRTVLDHICILQDIKSLKFVLYSTKLNDKFMVHLLYKAFENACKNGAAFEILNYLKHDRRALQRLLLLNNPMIRQNDHLTDDELETYYDGRKTSPLMWLCKSEDVDTVSVHLILYECALTDYERLQLILDESSQGWTAALYAVQNWQYPHAKHNALVILRYMANNHSQQMMFKLFQCMEYDDEYGTLLMKSLVTNADPITKFILESVNKMHYKSQIDILLRNALGLTIFDAIRRPKDMTQLFAVLQDTRVLHKLLCAMDESKGTNLSDEYNRKDIETRNALEILIEEYREYVAFAMLLDEYENGSGKSDMEAKMNDMLFRNDKCIKYAKYETNPFITACHLGKGKTIIKVMRHLIKKDGDKLRLLLLNHCYDKSTGDNCLMLLRKRGFNEVIVDMLDWLSVNHLNAVILELLSAKNRLSGEIIWTRLVKDNDMEMVQKMIQYIKRNDERMKIFSLKDNTNKSCFDFANMMSSKVIQQWIRN
eukprot:123619_1